MKNLNFLKALTAFILAFILVIPCAFTAFAEESNTSPQVGSEAESSGDSTSEPEPSSEEPSEPSSEEPSEPERHAVYVTVVTPHPGTCSLEGYESEDTTADGKKYKFYGDSVTFTINYHPSESDYLWGAYIGSNFYESYDGRTVTLTVSGDCTVSLAVSGLPTVKGEVKFTGTDVSGMYLTVDGVKFEKGDYVKGLEADIGIVLPHGLKAEKAEIVFSDGSAPVTVHFTDNKCVFPAIKSNFTVTVTISGELMYAVKVSKEGEGTVSADAELVKKGSRVVFTVVPAEGYFVESATLNGKSVAVKDGRCTASAMTDLVFHVVFTKTPSAQKVSISVDPRAAGGKIAFTNYTGQTADVPFGEKCEIIFTPNEGYVLDRVYINGTAASLNENRLTITADREYNIVAAFKKASYKITAVVSKSYGGKLEAVGYTMVNGMVSVDHGGSVTFRFTPDMGHMISSVKVDGAALPTPRNEYTFSNVTSNHTLSVSFVAEGASTKFHTVSVDCGPHGKVEPGNRLDVDDGDDLIITFVPDEGYEIDTVFYDGQPATLTQGKLVLVGITSDHIVQVTFKEKAAEAHDWLDSSDINWESDEVIIDISTTHRVGADVFKKIASYGAEKRFTFRVNGLFDVTLPTGMAMTVEGEYVDLSYDTMIDPAASEVFLQCLAENGVDSLYTILTLPDCFPTGSALTVALGNDFSAKTVNCFAFDGSALTKAKSGIVADLSGSVTLPLFDIRTVIFAIDSTAPENHIITVNCGPNGTSDPINSQAVADGGSLTIRIFPFDGYMVDKVTVDGEELKLDEEAKRNGACELPISNIKKDMLVDILFIEMPAEEESKVGLVFLIIIISVALVGGGVLFFIQWKRTKY